MRSSTRGWRGSNAHWLPTTYASAAISGLQNLRPKRSSAFASIQNAAALLKKRFDVRQPPRGAVRGIAKAAPKVFRFRLPIFEFLQGWVFVVRGFVRFPLAE